MTATSLFLVRSPLQLFNCVEAAQRYADCGRKVLVLLYRNPFDRELMERVLEDGDVPWDEVFRGDIRTNGAHLSLARKLLRRLPALEYCFVGDSTHLTNAVVNRRSPRKVVLVDDGTATYLRARRVARGACGRENSHQEALGPVRRAAERLLGLDERFLNRASFFTIYGDVARYSAALDVTVNDYRHFRKKVEGIPRHDGEAFFVGSDLRKGILRDPAAYDRFVERVARHYRGRKWTYVLHRKENDRSREYMEGLARRHGFALASFDRILEQQFRRQGWYPGEVSTILSSALDTVGVLYDTSAVAFTVEPSELSEKARPAYGEILARYRERNVTLVPLQEADPPRP